MPMYRIKCNTCYTEKDVFRSVADYDNLPHCCGEMMRRVLSAPAVLGDIAPYQSMVTGEYIGGRAQHRAHLKEHRLIEVGNDTQAILNPPKVDLAKGLKQTVIDVVNSKL